MRTSLTIELFFCLLAGSPALGQISSPVGVAAIARDARIGMGPLSGGSTIYSGEIVSTSKQGYVHVQAGAIQLRLGPETSVRLLHLNVGLVVQLRSGILSYSAVKPESFTIYVDDFRIVPAASTRMAGSIEMRRTCAVITQVRAGIAEIASAKQTVTAYPGENRTDRAEASVEYKKGAWLNLPILPHGRAPGSTAIIPTVPVRPTRHAPPEKLPPPKRPLREQS